ncbi:homoserine O-acetyltransferase MetX [Mucisphaera calidilacus]|uniref:Homoserine O-acetyltransferase n=1 Tax=Mucisphaera calidilacus TaxID=2527982 RepID=A0A518BW68_9BACT|nr:homoserine O-acetyltransferase [Mucisphaera calidilacus]QDU71201.1 Homoserine O-acetyltransferase [Mucisphaera calidilacus]
MNPSLPTSTDDVRDAGALRYGQAVALDGSVDLVHGGRLDEVTVCYESWGRLNAARDNAVLICHAISGDSHAASHDAEDTPGWWEHLIGPGKPVDTDRFFVICMNVLGGCRGTTGPNSVNPATGRAYGPDFPAITLEDIVDVQARALTKLGIDRLLAVVGGSLGGQQALVWGTRHGVRVRLVVPVATAPRLSTQALAFDVVGRNAIMSDPAFAGGRYMESGGTPATGLAIARMLGHITYLSREAMDQKFEADRLRPHDIVTEFEKRFSVGSYLAHQGNKFVERFDANSYVTLTLAMDMFDMGREAASLRRAFADSPCRWLLLSFSSDWLFPPRQSCEVVDALVAEGKRVTYCELPSPAGHDAFLLPDEVERYGSLIGARLEQELLGEVRTHGPTRCALSDMPTVRSDSSPTVFAKARRDYDRILELIPAGSRVLDLGCGEGELLSRLRSRGHEGLMGIDVAEARIIETARAGHEVIDHDMNEGLPQFADGAFDVVLLSQTLQALPNVSLVLSEMVRVGRRAVVSFPNFAFWKIREMLYKEGRSPKSVGEYGYEWHNTPNRRFPSIADFEDFCAKQGLVVHRAVHLDSEAGEEVAEDPNRNADLSIFVLSR